MITHKKTNIKMEKGRIVAVKRVVYPEENIIEANILNEERYYHRLYGINDPDIKEDERAPESIPVLILPGLEIDLRNIFY